MGQKRCVYIIVVLLFSLVAVSIGCATSTTPSSCHVSTAGDIRVINSSRGGCIKSQVLKNKIHINVYNPTSKYLSDTGYVVLIDGARVQRNFFDLQPGEDVRRNISFSKNIDITNKNHTITVSTYGSKTTYNFTEKINASTTTKVPTPYITNVTVADGTIDGKPSSVAYVTVVNPSMRHYSMKLFVHTIGTDGSLYPAIPQPHNSTTIKVELLDKQDTKIAGEARLYTGNLTKKSGGVDQVGFAGKAGEGSKQWNESFQPVRPTWMNNHYHYTNDTYSQSFGEKLSGDHEVDGIPIIYLTPFLLVGLLFVRRWR